ncbi:MAG: hypothetical protein KC503_12860 [Myxococcales bacterium]|nr:hypothetical protein [Myxococcales bacterium]
MKTNRLRSSLRLTLVFAIVATSSLAFANPHGKAPAGKACKAFAPNQRGRISMRLPKIHRPSGRIVSWGDQTTWQPLPRWGVGGGSHVNRDPYDITVKGYNEGSKVTAHRQLKSNDIVLPDTCMGGLCASKDKKITNRKKLLKKQRSREWRKAVASALNYEQFNDLDINVASANQEQKKHSPAVMETHTPFKLLGKDVFGRKYATVHGNVEGLPTRNENTQRQQGGRTQPGTISHSGMHVPAYDIAANTNPKNIFITPAYTRGDTFKGEAQAKMLGLAAFPAGTTITVTNTRLEGLGIGAERHTVSFKASKSGSGAQVFEALQRDRLRVSVSYPAVQNQAHGQTHTFYLRVPRAAGKEAIKARGVKYYRAEQADAGQ